MAVYTEITDAQLAAFIAAYEIGELLSCKGIAEGSENSNYLIRTSSGQFILTLYEKRVLRADLPYFLDLMEHLAGKGIACPLPVKGRDGRALHEIARRPAAVITFLEGVCTSRPLPHHCAEIGKALALLHRAGLDFPKSRENSQSLPEWRRLYATNRQNADKVAKGLADVLGQELNFLGEHWPADLPCGVIHGDLFPDNVFFIGEKLSGLIDFYFACNDLLAYDIAICLNAWCFEPDGAFNITKARTLLAGYRSVRSLTDAELGHLPILARGASLRFLLTRLHDWLNPVKGAIVKAKDPLEYLTRLRFHQGISNPSAYGLSK
jgi:homoserine kinase type II